MAKILIVDDEEKMTHLVSGELEDNGYRCDIANSGQAALEKFRSNIYDIVITDLRMDPPDGLALLRKIKAENSQTEVIIMTAYATASTAVEAMKSGAYDYIIKPFSLDELVLKVEKILDEKRRSDRLEQLEEDLKSRSYDTFIGESKPVKRLFELVEKVSRTDANVLLLGKSGTGKELVANMIHSSSPRRERPFVAVNCAALTETLLESELFGHEKGAFTGAIKRKPGRFELAEGGTLFLDEIGEMSGQLQAKLLRALEERKITRVGGTEEIDIDVRVISATNRDLEADMEGGEFREDLYFRLNVFPIRIPSLSERVDDIPLLANYFARKSGYGHGDLAPEVLDLLKEYNWRGNVRELKNIIERALILSDGDRIRPEHIAVGPAKQPERLHLRAGSPEEGLDEMEKAAVIDALQKARGNKTRAAEILKITRRMLYTRLKKYGLD
ncbi:MAG TPA: sigma-54-dependent Fis family transcriptional regulator [candidate division Zixibacteria bacterium]|nr:sigma-54-dependent Fis family transcriptional regulator [candidate division Zixibacteria bacterium]HER00613.1 sigma-54-dependent Fis family transcriptional regulator [candidate division Zixibacteria bacterium]